MKDFLLSLLVRRIESCSTYTLYTSSMIHHPFQMNSDSYGHGNISICTARAGHVLHLQAACQTHNPTAVSAERSTPQIVIVCHNGII